MSGPFGSTAWMANPASGLYGFEISNSLRFEDGDSAYLSRTPSSASNRRTFTISKWVKRGNFGTRQNIFSADSDSTLDGGTAFYYEFQADNTLRVGQYQHGAGWNWSLITSQVFRDVSSWYHITISIDTTQGTASNRCKIYVNGQIITAFGTEDYPSENYDNAINTALPHFVGKLAATSSTLQLDGYLADVNFIDGTALTPSSFGETKNDIWIPKDTSGLTFGTNGFRQQFKQTGTGTASSSTIGADTSGNDNHWTSTNLVASDVVPDSPTNNFATFNSIHDDTTGASTEVFSEGNLEVGESGTGWSNIFGSQGMPSGKWYWESYMAGSGTVDCLFGIAKSNWYVGSDSGLETAGAYTIYQHSNGNLYSWNNASQTNEGTTVTFTWGDILQVAYDADTGKLWFGKSNTWLFSGDPSAGSTPKMTIGASDIGDMLPAWSQYHADNAWGVNFGQDSSFAGNVTAQGNADANGIGDFYYAPPSGFLALCTANLPAPVATIDPAQGGSPQDYFNTVLYTGTGSALDVNTVGFQPDWVWLKQRNAADNHVLFDSVRGAATELYSNLTNAESGSTGSLTAFDSAGFNLGNSGDLGRYNESSSTYASWNWKAGTAFSNDASATGVGSIDSSGSVNTDVGFSIISWTGTGANATVAHGLGAIPKMYIVKRRDADGYSWAVYNSTLGATKQLRLSGTNAEITTADIWNNTEPTSSVFSIGTNTDSNASSGTYIAYCFASVDGYSKFGSYTGNGNADGSFVYTGFRPAFVLIKSTSAVESWNLFDTARDPSNLTTQNLNPNVSNAESDASSGARAIDILSNGFKLRGANSAVNDGTYIYLAFAEQPFKYANAR